MGPLDKKRFAFDDDADSRRRLLLLGFASVEAVIPEGGSDYFIIRNVLPDDTFTRDDVELADGILINLGSRGGLIARAAAIQARTKRPLPIITVGYEMPDEELRKELMPVVHLVPPIDPIYLLGLVDAFRHDHGHITSLDDEREHLSVLYELSSSLLRVHKREQLSPVLHATLPSVMDGEFILLSLPESPDPLVFHYARPGMGRRHLPALKEHLEESWNALRPESPVTWEWLLDLNSSDTQFPGPKPARSSFASAPITVGRRSVGFLTVLPKMGRRSDEDWLKTFFLCADLVNVLLQSIELREQLEFEATHDSLTGLFNRQRVLEDVDRECRRADRYGVPLSVVMLDLDHFKQVNDTWGHQAGDKVLQAFAEKLRGSLREFDAAGRFGGEEFLILLPHTDSRGAQKWATRLLEDLNASPVFANGAEIRVTASCGITTSSAGKATTDSLIAASDAALYEAKGSGRNCLRTADHDSIQVTRNTPVA